MVHSVDAYVLRCIHRRCNYDADVVESKYVLIFDELQNRNVGCPASKPTEEAIEYYVDIYSQSGMADVVVLPYIDKDTVRTIPTDMLESLKNIVNSMLVHKPFEVVTVHDEFKCHPNHMNHLRQHYINVFAELADSTVLDMILGKIYGTKGTYPKLSNNLSESIRNSSYALC